MHFKSFHTLCQVRSSSVAFYKYTIWPDDYEDQVLTMTYLQLKVGNKQRQNVWLWVCVSQQELETAVDSVEEAINNHLIKVVNVRLPDVCLFISMQERFVLLPTQNVWVNNISFAVIWKQNIQKQKIVSHVFLSIYKLQCILLIKTEFFAVQTSPTNQSSPEQLHKWHKFMKILFTCMSIYIYRYPKYGTCSVTELNMVITLWYLLHMFYIERDRKKITEWTKTHFEQLMQLLTSCLNLCVAFL